MQRLCLNSRDELLIIELKKVEFFHAKGNYSYASCCREGKGGLEPDPEKGVEILESVRNVNFSAILSQI